jgi:alpha-methylacyl-CoA racemase
MLLADMGADVVRVDRTHDVGTAAGENDRRDPYGRNKRSIAIDLKRAEGVSALLQLVEAADALIEPYRPGVMERLGIGPDVCLARNPKLVYGRMTGWGQEGPLAQSPGRDLNYIALSGALYSMGPAERPPVPPLNLVGDLAGGALYLAFGLVCGLMEALQTGRGQIIDATMIDGANGLMTGVYGYRQSGRWSRQRGGNFLDGGAPFYSTYETRDGKFVSVAAIEAAGYAQLLFLLGIDSVSLPPQNDPAGWTYVRSRITASFLTKTRDEWCGVFADSDACFAPVLDLDEAPAHPHNVARDAFVMFGGLLQPRPAPRFSLTPASLYRAPPAQGQDSRSILSEWGMSETTADHLMACGAVRQFISN